MAIRIEVKKTLTAKKSLNRKVRKGLAKSAMKERKKLCVPCVNLSVPCGKKILIAKKNLNRKERKGLAILIAIRINKVKEVLIFPLQNQNSYCITHQNSISRDKYRERVNF